MISVCAKTLKPVEAEEYFGEMIAARVSPSTSTFSCMIETYARSGQKEKAWECYTRMCETHVDRNEYTYCSLMKTVTQNAPHTVNEIHKIISLMQNDSIVLQRVSCVM